MKVWRKILIVFLLFAVNNSLICNKLSEPSKTIKRDMGVIETIIRIRVKYPPSPQGMMKLWNDYKNNKN